MLSGLRWLRAEKTAGFSVHCHESLSHTTWATHILEVLITESCEQYLFKLFYLQEEEGRKGEREMDDNGADEWKYETYPGLICVFVTRGSNYLFCHTVQFQGQVERRWLAVVHSVAPRTATPLPSRRRSVQLLYSHVTIRATLWREGHKLSDSKCVKGQLQTRKKYVI